MTSSQTYPRRPLTTVAHLAVLGTAGWVVIGTFLGILGAGFGLLFLFGFGLVVFAGLIYVMFAIGWFETARVNGLYRLGVLAPTFARQHEPGFANWVKSLGRQLKDGPMWRALTHFLLACVLGAGLIAIIPAVVWSINLALSPLGSAETVTLPLGFEISPSLAPVYGVLGVLLSIGVTLALALLHHTLSLAIIGSGAREAQLTQQAQRSHQQHAGAVRAADVERTRIERDLHDGVQPRLVSVGMTLGIAHQTIDEDPRAAKDLISEAHTSTKAAITELRQLARGIHASVLDDRGLDAALSALAGRSHIPVNLDVRVNGRLERDAEAAVYFVIAESLTNAAKHSRASEARVTVRVREAAVDPAAVDPAAVVNSAGEAGAPAGPRILWARVEDNGIGGARVLPGGGLDGISNRVLAAGGTITIDSPTGGPTTVEVSVPCAS